MRRRRLAARLDQQVTIFSPTGQLHQVEFAKRAAGWYNTTVGLKTQHTAVLINQKFIADKSIVPESVKNLRTITPTIGFCMTGCMADGRHQMCSAIDKAVHFRASCGYEMPAKTLCDQLADIHQMFSMHLKTRSLGCSITMIDYDEKLGPTLHMADAAGECQGYKGCALGPHADKAEAYLLKYYDANLSEERTIQLAIDCLCTAMDVAFEPLHLEVGLVSKDHPEFRILNQEEISLHILKLLESQPNSNWK